MNTKIKPGDLVKLKSGGPKMTVKGFKKIRGMKGNTIDYDIIICQWFNDNNELNSQEFKVDTLEIVNS